MCVCMCSIGLCYWQSDYQSVQQKHKFWNSVNSVCHFRWEMATQCSPGQIQLSSCQDVHRWKIDRLDRYIYLDRSIESILFILWIAKITDVFPHSPMVSFIFFRASERWVPAEISIQGCWVTHLGTDGLLGVAGMMKLLVMTGIIPENSLRKTKQ